MNGVPGSYEWKLGFTLKPGFHEWPLESLKLRLEWDFGEPQSIFLRAPGKRLLPA